MGEITVTWGNAKGATWRKSTQQPLISLPRIQSAHSILVLEIKTKASELLQRVISHELNGEPTKRLQSDRQLILEVIRVGNFVDQIQKASEAGGDRRSKRRSAEVLLCVAGRVHDGLLKQLQPRTGSWSQPDK